MLMRMTLDEMRTAYPNTWLGITNVEKNDHGAVVSAEVVYTDKTASELGMMSLKHQGVQPYFTTPDNTFFVGTVM